MYDLVEKVPSRRFYKTEISIYGSKFFLYTLYLVTPETFGRGFRTKSTESCITLILKIYLNFSFIFPTLAIFKI